jgi:hypothetical protein
MVYFDSSPSFDKSTASVSVLPKMTYDLPAGFVINGESADNSSSLSVSSAGDVNGDGLDDLIVGAYQANPSDKPNAGKSYVIFGKTDTDAAVCSKAVILLALMIIVSLPTPALKTSMPPLPVRVSLPAPATKISSLLVTVLVRVLSSLLPR